MNFQVFSILASAILVPFITGLIRLRSIRAGGFTPVFLYVATGLINSILSYILILHKYPNHTNSNIYILISFLLLLYQFYRWNKGTTMKYIFLGLAGILVWLIDNPLLHRLNENNSAFRALFSFAMLFFSVEQISKVTFSKRRNLNKLAILFICIGLLVHFSFKCYIETLNLFEANLGTQLVIRLNIIMTFINLVTYALISTAFLCIRTKTIYFYPYW